MIFYELVEYLIICEDGEVVVQILGCSVRFRLTVLSECVFVLVSMIVEYGIPFRKEDMGRASVAGGYFPS